MEMPADDNNETDSLLTTDDDVDREEFNREIEEMLRRKRAPNTFLLSRSKYYALVEQVKAAKSHLKKTPADYRRAKRYDVIQTHDGERLIMALQPGQTGQQVFVTMDEIYDVLREYHLKLNHGGRTRMMTVLKPKYKNVTAECVLVYLSLCKSCRNKSFKRKRSDIVKKKRNPSASSSLRHMENDSEEEEYSMERSPFDFNESEPIVSVPMPNIIKNENHFTNDKKVYPELCSRGQVDVLVVTPEEKEEYKYMLVYRHYVTKFIHLRALKTTTIDETVDNLLDIFLVFGAPNILQSKNGAALTKPISRRISVLRPDILVLASDCNFSDDDFKGKSNEDILKMVNTWLSRNNNVKWQKGLKHVQHSLNTTFHTILCRTPSEVVFGADPRKGIASVLPLDICQNLATDNDLRVALKEKETPKTENVLSEESLILPSDFIKVETEVMEDDIDM